MTTITVTERGGIWPTKAMTQDWAAGWWLEEVGNGNIETHGPGRANTCAMRPGNALTGVDISEIDPGEPVEYIETVEA